MPLEAPVGGRPGGAQLDLGGGAAFGQRPEVLRVAPGHRAARLGVAGAVRLQRVRQPAPADLGQQRVAGHLRLQLGAGHGDHPEVPVPGLRRVRVVQQHQGAVGQFLAVHLDRGGQCEGVRGQPAGGGLRGQPYLGTQPRPGQRLDRLAELDRRRLPARSSTLCGLPADRCHVRKPRRRGPAIRALSFPRRAEIPEIGQAGTGVRPPPVRGVRFAWWAAGTGAAACEDVTRE